MGEGVKERREFFEKFKSERFIETIADTENYLRALCDDVKKQRKRIGGDWAVCEVLLSSKKMRDFVKYTLFDR